MVDKNGKEIKTGDIVEITGAFFKNDNGCYFVDRSPGDAGWSGEKYSLKRISTRGKISKAKNNICSWPLVAYVSSRVKRAEARAWNKEHAQIEVVKIENMAEVKAHFEEEAVKAKGMYDYNVQLYGEEDSAAETERKRIVLFESIAQMCGA